MKPGTVIGARFELERQAGAGAMGLVFRAHDRVTGEAVALKLLRTGSARLAERFEREAAMLAGIAHPHIVRLVTHGATEDGDRFIAMEWLDGEDLESLLSRETPTVAESIDLGIAAAEALGTAHRAGIVHRDVKPSNLFLAGGDPRRVKVVDFGVARWQRGAALTVPGAALGTPGYMAPEQARGSEEVSPRADVFALGCVLYECLTGRPAFRAEHLMSLLTKVLFEEVPSARERVPELPEPLDLLVASMVAKDPDRRPTDGLAVAAALRAIRRDVDGETGGRRAARSERPPSLTEDEQRLVSIVVAGRTCEADEEADTLLGEAPDARDRRAELATVASAFGGAIERVGSGGLVVLFESLGSAVEQATRAARCALSLHAAAPEWPIAVATGGAVLSERVGGDCIARAFEMLRETVDGRVRLDEATESLLGPELIVQEGLLAGERDTRSPARTVLGRETPFVGRQPELVACTAAWEECVEDGVAQVVLLVGDAGTGKSRLLHEALSRIGADVWHARSAPLTASSALGVIARMVRAKAGLAETARDARAHAALCAWIAHWVEPAELARIADFVGEIAGAPAPEPGMQLAAARNDPFLMGDHVRRAFRELFEASTARAPVVLALEDVHWADVPSIKLIDHVLAAVRDRPLLVLATARPEVDAQHPKLWSGRKVTRLPMRPLPPRVSQRLVAALLPDAPADEQRALVERAGGNPFHIEELARAAARGHRDRVPRALVAIAQARMERLPMDARRILRGASAFGETFPAGGIASMLGADTAGALDARLEELEQEEILVREPTTRFADETEWSFRHAILRDAAYAMLTETDRALAHSLAGRWLASHGETDALLVARQLERGETPAEAVPHYVRAAKAALDATDYEGAVASAQRALSLGAEGETAARAHVIVAEACYWIGLFVEGGAEADRALAIFAQGSQPWLEAVACRARLALRTGDIDRVAELTGAMPETGGLELRVALAHLATPLLVGGRVELAHRILDRLAGSTEPTVEAPLHRALAHAALGRSDMVAYIAHSEAALRAYEALGHEGAAAGERGNVGYGLMQLGRLEEAEVVFREVIESLERPGLPAPLVGALRAHHGRALALLGDLEGARTEIEAAVAALTSQGERRLLAGARLNLGMVLASLGDREGARTEALAALSLLAHAPSARLSACGEVALLLFDIGCDDEAIALATEAYEAFAARDRAHESGTALLLAYAEALSRSGRAEEAREVAARLRALVHERAAAIDDPATRESFLRRGPHTARAVSSGSDPEETS